MADQIPNDLVPAPAAAPQASSAIPNDLIPAEQAPRQPQAAIPSDLVPAEAAPTGAAPGSDELMMQQLAAGFKKNVGYQLLRNGTPIGIASQLLEHTFKNKQDLPTPSSLGLPGFVTENADPISIGAGKVAGGLAKSALAGATARLATTAAGDSAATALTKSFGQKMLESAATAPIEFGAFSGVKEAAKQLQDGEFKPNDLATEAAKGAALGLIAGPTLTGAGELLGKFASKLSAPSKLALATEKTSAMDQAWSDANDQIAKLVGDGKVKPEDAQLFIAKQTQDNLTAQGASIYGKNVVTPVTKFLNSLENASQFDSKLGTRSYETVHNMVTGENEFANKLQDLRGQVAGPFRQLEKSGAAPDQVTSWMHHMEDTPDGDIQFNPNPLAIPGKVDRQAFSGTLPTPDQFSALQQLRAVYSKTFIENPEFAERAGFVQGYVPIQEKAGFSTAPSQASSRGITDPSFLNARESGTFDPAVHETDFRVLTDSYLKKAARFTAFNDKIPQLQNEIMKFQAMGQKGAADNIAASAMQAMGLRDHKDLASVFTDRFLQDNNKMLGEVAKQMPDPTGFMSEVGKVVRDATYNNLVFANPLTWLKHAVQPELVGAAEIGPRWVASGRAGLLTSDGRALAKELMPFAKRLDGQALDTAIQGKATSTTGKVLDNILGAVGKPGKFIMHGEDSINRATMMIGAYRQFQKTVGKYGADALPSVMDGLLHGEKQLVQSAFEKDGPEEAAKVYALIRQRRVMFAYSMADKPELMSQGMGAMVPFTTWGRNAAMRLVGDVQNASYGTLAKRIAYPLIGLGTFKALTGYEIPNANPTLEAAGALKSTAYPAVGALADAWKQGSLKPLAPFTPLGPIQKVQKLYDKSDGDFLQYGLKLKKAEGDTALQRALPDFIRKALNKD